MTSRWTGHARSPTGSVPLLPRLCGTLMIRSQLPQARTFVAPRQAQPSSSPIAGHIIQCSVTNHNTMAPSACVGCAVSIRRGQ